MEMARPRATNAKTTSMCDSSIIVTGRKKDQETKTKKGGNNGKGEGGRGMRFASLQRSG